MKYLLRKKGILLLVAKIKNYMLVRFPSDKNRFHKGIFLEKTLHAVQRCHTGCFRIQLQQINKLSQSELKSKNN